MKPLITNIEEKLESITKKHTKHLKRRIADRGIGREWRKEYYSKKLENPLADALGIPYQTRNKVFKGCNGKLMFDPVTGRGTSYFDGYEISKVIKGKLVLNAYGYSVTTSNHVSVLRSLFHTLGLKYIEVEAPAGLQDLESCEHEHTEQWAKLEVKRLHARKVCNWSAKRQAELLTNAKLIGIRISKRELKVTVAFLEKERRRLLDTKRETNKYFAAVDRVRKTELIPADLSPTQYLLPIAA